MKVAFGTKAHSGWAALVVLGQRDGDVVLVDRRRIELVEDEWAKQPYHAAEDLKPDAARDLVERGVEAAHRKAVREMRAAVERERGNEVTGCAVLVGDPMPDWSTEEILAVHFRMHKAEGELFRDVLVAAAEACKLPVAKLPDKSAMDSAAAALGIKRARIEAALAKLGKMAGPPWRSEQKEAAVAALVALESGGRP